MGLTYENVEFKNLTEYFKEKLKDFEKKEQTKETDQSN